MLPASSENFGKLIAGEMYEFERRFQCNRKRQYKVVGLQCMFSVVSNIAFSVAF